MKKNEPKKSGGGVDKSHGGITIEADTVYIEGDVVAQNKISAEPKIISVRNYEKVALVGHSGPLIVQNIPRDSINDVAQAERIRIIGKYLDAMKIAAGDPSGPIVTVDITGVATGFTNWIENQLYRAILTFNKAYDEAFRRRHGDRPGVIRNFIIDPTRMDAEAIENLKGTLKMHVDAGLRACIIYTGSKVPAEVIADIATISDRLAVDVGHLERLDSLDIGPKDVFAAIRDKQFEEIREKVAWTMDKKNIDEVVTRQEDIEEVVRDLRRRSKIWLGGTR